MIVCNLIVVVTYIYRVFWSSPDGDLPTESESSLDDDDFTTRSPRGTQNLTTVDLDSPLTGLTGSVSEVESGFYHLTVHSIWSARTIS